MRYGKVEGVISVGNPYSTRPYQHVLEPLVIYLTIACEQWNDLSKSGCYNIGPDDMDCVMTGNFANLSCKYWNVSDDGFPKARWGNHADPNGRTSPISLNVTVQKLRWCGV